MYQNGFKNKIGKQCPCCGEFIPISAYDDYGHHIEFAQPPLGLCQNCASILMNMINDKRKENDSVSRPSKY